MRNVRVYILVVMAIASVLMCGFKIATSDHIPKLNLVMMISVTSVFAMIFLFLAYVEYQWHLNHSDARKPKGNIE